MECTRICENETEWTRTVLEYTEMSRTETGMKGNEQEYVELKLKGAKCNLSAVRFFFFLILIWRHQRHFTYFREYFISFWEGYCVITSYNEVEHMWETRKLIIAALSAGSVENEECGVRSAECGKCGVWKVRSVESAECGKWGVWKM